MNDLILFAKLSKYKKDAQTVDSDIASAYTACENKGATLPATQNSANLANTIDSIPTGGGGGDVVENPALRLIDWEGTILKEYSKADALALETLPTPSTLSAYEDVDHEYLLFQEWSRNLANIKTWLTSNPGERLNIVAVYTTTDSETHNFWDSPRGEGATKISSQKRATAPIGNGVFTNYYSLRNINIPKSTTYVGTSAFENDYNLRFIGLPNEIERIDASAFKDCRHLASIILPDGMTAIGNAAFQTCCSLESIFIPDSVTSMGYSLFKHCYSLKDVHISSGATSIGATAFNYCYSLGSIRIPSSVTVIGDYAFTDCTSLFDIILEGKPTLSSTNVFNNTPATQKIYVPRANLSWFETATNWSTMYSKFVAIEDNIAYLESLGYNVDAYKGGAA